MVHSPDNMQWLIDSALEQGAYQAALLKPRDLIIDERVRLKCQVPICPHYNQCLMCPPHTMSLKQFRKVTEKYELALLVQVKSAGWEEQQVLAAEQKLHGAINHLESQALARGCYFAAGFIASSCKLCPNCVGIHSRKGCLHPYKARPSIEAMGVDIYRTAMAAGLPFELGSGDGVVYCGLLLVK